MPKASLDHVQEKKGEYPHSPLTNQPTFLHGSNNWFTNYLSITKILKKRYFREFFFLNLDGKFIMSKS